MDLFWCLFLGGKNVSLQWYRTAEGYVTFLCVALTWVIFDLSPISDPRLPGKDKMKPVWYFLSLLTASSQKDKEYV